MAPRPRFRYPVVDMSKTNRLHAPWVGLAVAAALALASCGGAGDAPRTGQKKHGQEANADQMLAGAIDADEAGQPTIAEQRYTRALRMRPDHTETADRFIGFLIAQNRPADALAVARAFLDRSPGNLQSYHLLGLAQIAAGDYDSAVGTLTTLVELDSADASAWEKRGRAHLLGGDAEAGVSDLRRAVELVPDNAEFRVSLGSALHRVGQLDEAALHLRGALQLDDDHARAHMLLGNVLREQLDVQAALSHHIKAARADPGNSRLHFELGITQNMVGDNLAAEQSLRTAVELEPGDATNWYAYGEILRMLEEWERAVTAYERALQIDPNYLKAPGKLGTVLYYADRVDDAEVVLTAAIRRQPEDPYLYLNLGLVYEKGGKLRLAVEALERFLELAPRDDGDVPIVRRKVRDLRRKIR
jgi:tetratricopeptide (TPR) repeat protein